jgi:hypothetical protein
MGGIILYSIRGKVGVGVAWLVKKTVSVAITPKGPGKHSTKWGNALLI